ncbi:hypothetical protein, conserved [Entamoeba dispar SAW760]|uniref:Uncharacterized protein n=1 Tax=Entamoeba dispar (strain ATCC PRA-260 / SAW760) TaxID=370354 RepID=B0EQW9_ENTDS|nr:uncharacterized protein EDI_099320 [Entamoeba dispar SAW760]EDR23082.1 hypothetical protein, conserved [Entamoeba dispar SAW760]|eukprot:EDR23082.1 hypothetical protein, conserved [Entamoeba dispar SAW760]
MTLFVYDLEKDIKWKETKKSDFDHKKFDIFKFTRQVATKFFDLAVSGEFKKDFRSEKKLEKHQKIILKEQQKQEKKELKNFKRREKRHTIQTTLEELEKVNDDIKKNEQLVNSNVNTSENNEELLPTKSNNTLTERKQQSLNSQQIIGRKDKVIKKELSEQEKDNLLIPNEKAKLSAQKDSSSFCSFEFMKQKDFIIREEKDKTDNFFIHTLPFQEETKSQEGTPKRSDSSSNELERVRSASPLGESEAEEKKKKKINLSIKERIIGSSAIQSAIHRVRHSSKTEEKKEEK